MAASAVAGNQEHQTPLPTLLSASRRSAALTGGRAGHFPKAKLEIAIPEPAKELHAYPAEAVHVRNTFIHIVSPAASQNRTAVSCPSCHIGRLHNAFPEEEVREEDVNAESSGSFTKQVLCLEAVLGEPVPSTPEPLAMRLPCYEGPGRLNHLLAVPGREARGVSGYSAWSQQGLPAFYPPQGPAQLAAPPGAAICAVSMPVPAEPAPGSPELPSIGSKGHHAGDCKPCAFLHVKGCDNGAMCKFCHLCDAGEKKRRQKAKKAAFKLGGA